MVLADLVHDSRLDSNTNGSSYDCTQSWLDQSSNSSAGSDLLSIRIIVADRIVQRIGIRGVTASIQSYRI